MRFCTKFNLKNETLPKDKNRVFMHIMKKLFEEVDEETYKSLYELEVTRQKNFTFSLYLGNNASFLREEIQIPDRRVLLNFSTSDISLGILYYNSFVLNKGRLFETKENELEIGRTSLVREKIIDRDTVIFKTLSPIVVREHSGDNKETWYHDIKTEEGLKIFYNNLRYQLMGEFKNIPSSDLDSINIHILDSKIVSIRHYDIQIPSNISTFKISAQPYILDYLYKSGIGSKKSSGFGLLEIVGGD